MNAELENLLKSKPDTEKFFDSVRVSKDFWAKLCKEQNTLVEDQRKELQNLIPDDNLYKTPFSL